MKRSVLIGILVIEAIVCVVLHLLQTSYTAVFTTAMAFPFEQIGLSLRTLSLSGSLGNAIAIAVYIAVSLLPVMALLTLRQRRPLQVEDSLLGLLSAVLFAALYCMINPGIITSWTGLVAGQSVGKAILGGIVYSVLCGYLVMRVLRLFFTGGTDKLIRYMSLMLGLLNVIFVYIVFGAYFDDLLNSFSALQAGNRGNEHMLGTSYFFLVLKFIIDSLPYVLNTVVVFAAMRLLNEMRIDRYSADTVTASRYITRLCMVVLTTTVLSNIGYNLLQLLFAKELRVVNASIQFPVLSIIFVLAALLLTRFIVENKQLKDDNELFI